MSAETEKTNAEPRRIAGRYELRGVLGRGGMATVHRAFDSVTGRQVALKQRTVSRGGDRDDRMFEREFHVLSSLAHPSIIQVHDYGVDEAGAYYTMELLEGGDLRELSPLPWQEACSLLYDVCSSLALVHSRRYVHRDISPRNVRRTTDGRAKLIDFGAMVAMGHDELVVGTPAFVAPEVLNLSLLDARTDLFSLGATLYFSLTGRAPFPARTFAELEEAWRQPLFPPSRFAPDVPDALDALVASLLSIEPAMRPRTAFEVMQRLAAMGGFERSESEGVSRAYLSTPVLVGRERLLSELRAEMQRAHSGTGRSFIVQAAPGLGRTRVLDHSVLDAKAAGWAVLRARPTFANAQGASLAESLGNQLVQAVGNAALDVARTMGLYSTLFDLAAPSASAASGGDGSVVLPRLAPFPEGPPGARQQEAFVRWLLQVARTVPVLVVVDDVHRFADGPTTLLSTFADDAGARKLMLLVSAQSGAAPLASGSFLTLKSRSQTRTLDVLGEEDTLTLLTSLFGDIPNVGIVGHAVHGISGGNPRACLDLVQHLVDRGAIKYGGGAWSLPSRIDPSDLPESAEAAIRARIAALLPLSRTIAESQALTAQASFGREDYAELCPAASSSEIESSIAELVAKQILVRDGGFYSFAHRGWASSLSSGLGTAEKKERHRGLAKFYGSRPGLAAVHHMLEGGLEEGALTRLFELLATVQSSGELREVFQLDADETATTFARALRVTIELGRPLREVTTMRRWLASLAVASDDSYYWMSAPAWLEQLKLDSGYDAWEALAGVEDPDERRKSALRSAYSRYGSLPEAERVYAPDEAIRLLVHYVAISIAIGSRCQDIVLVKSLPPLLEPFAPLAPGVDAILHNAMATREARAFGQPELARSRWRDVYERLGKMKPDEVESLVVIRHAIASGIGSVEAQMGIASAAHWAELLEQDQLQQVHALYLRKVVQLQQGDWEGADRFRRRAELLEITARARQMFTSSLNIEVAAHAMAGDLTGLQQVIDRIEPLAERCPGWVPYHHLARGRFEQIRGNMEAARSEYERALSRATPDPDDPSRAVPAFAQAGAGLVETLTALGAHEEAYESGARMLARCTEIGLGVGAHELARATALADAKLGNFDRAAEAMDRVIHEQLEYGISGLNLGASYEARTRVAIWAGDDVAVHEYASLTAREYRHRRGSPLGGRYERLMEEAVRSGALPSFAPAAYESATGIKARAPMHDVVVTEAMTGAETRVMRAQRALRLLGEENKPVVAHLYLFGDDGLKLAGSLGDRPPPDDLFEFVSSRFSDAQGEMLTMTLCVPADQVPVTSEAVFIDAAGMIYDPVILTCSLGDGMRHAGVAVLAYRERPRRAASTTLAAAVAAHLIRSGDTTGFAVNG